MNIQPISELEVLDNNKSTLFSLSAVNAYFEVSYPYENYFKSYAISLCTFVKNIVDQLVFLSGKIDNLSNQTIDISNSYVKKSGDTMNGGLSINVPNSTALFIENGEINISSTNNDLLPNTPINIHNNVFINNGGLSCTKEISGCALTAKWC